MAVLNISINNKVATFHKRGGGVVCRNTDYKIEFTFDSEWEGYENKTARFVWGGRYQDVPIEGTTCVMPEVYRTESVKVGVYAGDLSTTTPAVIPCQASVLCAADEPHDEEARPNINEAKEAAEKATQAAEAAAEAAAAADVAATTAQEAAESAQRASEEIGDIGEAMNALQEQVRAAEETANNAIENASSARANSEMNQQQIERISNDVSIVWEHVDANTDNITSLENQMGDIETALEAIIEIQGNLIGE